jgi:hypothetical protein
MAERDIPRDGGLYPSVSSGSFLRDELQDRENQC